MKDTCPACKGKDLENFWPDNFGNVYICKNCGTIIPEDFGGHNGNTDRDSLNADQEVVH